MKYLCFIFTTPVNFIHSTIKVSKYYFAFIFLILILHIIFAVLQRNASSPAVPSCYLWRGINTDNSVIRGSNLKGHKPSFWICVNLSDTFKTQMKQGNQSLLCDYFNERKRWVSTKNFLYGVFDHDWYDFGLKYWCLCIFFSKTQISDPASRDPWCH